jgi:sulfur-oxidizing protein SoxX
LATDRLRQTLTAFGRGRSDHCQPVVFVLLTPYNRQFTDRSENTLLPPSISISALALGLWLVACTGSTLAQSGPSDGQKLAFDRGKGNCLTCHVIKGGDLPGTIGPKLEDLKSRYDRTELIAIVSDETKRNPQTVMPPFGRNRILTEQEINAIVDFLQTL